MIIKIFNILKIIFLILFLIFSIYASKFYQGSIFIFGIYCVSFISMFFFLTSRKSSYFEIFFSSYLFLGFWFKFIFSLIFYNGVVFDSGQDNSRNIDDILVIGIFISITCLFSSFISKKIINEQIPNNNIITDKFFFQIFYLNNRILILFLFILLIIVVSFLNYKFSIYHRGFITITETSYLINNLIKWLLLFGLTTFSCFIIHTEIIYKKKIKFITVFIALFEIFISFSSMLSRLFSINALSIILPTYQQSNKLKERNDQKFFILIISVLIFSLLSIYVVNHLRVEKLNSIKQDWKNIYEPNFINQLDSNLQSKIENYKFQIPEKRITSNKVTNFILINRWIGIDSLILVHNSKKLSFSLLFESLNESKQINTDNTFYETTFGLSSDKINISTHKEILKGNTLPGIISFLYYSGNLNFVLISLFLIIIIFNFFEHFIKKITGFNIIFACFLSNIIATRLIHFGYAPKESYLFVISVILSVIIMIFLSRTKVYFFRKR
jgi:hypothetical protein